MSVDVKLALIDAVISDVGIERPKYRKKIDGIAILASVDGNEFTLESSILIGLYASGNRDILKDYIGSLVEFGDALLGLINKMHKFYYVPHWHFLTTGGDFVPTVARVINNYITNEIKEGFHGDITFNTIASWIRNFTSSIKRAKDILSEESYCIFTPGEYTLIVLNDVLFIAFDNYAVAAARDRFKSATVEKPIMYGLIDIIKRHFAPFIIHINHSIKLDEIIRCSEVVSEILRSLSTPYGLIGDALFKLMIAEVSLKLAETVINQGWGVSEGFSSVLRLVESNGGIASLLMDTMDKGYLKHIYDLLNNKSARDGLYSLFNDVLDSGKYGYLIDFTLEYMYRVDKDTLEISRARFIKPKWDPIATSWDRLLKVANDLASVKGLVWERVESLDDVPEDVLNRVFKRFPDLALIA